MFIKLKFTILIIVLCIITYINGENLFPEVDDSIIAEPSQKEVFIQQKGIKDRKQLEREEEEMDRLKARLEMDRIKRLAEVEKRHKQIRDEVDEQYKRYILNNDENRRKYARGVEVII